MFLILEYRQDIYYLNEPTNLMYVLSLQATNNIVRNLLNCEVSVFRLNSQIFQLVAEIYISVVFEGQF